MRPLNPASVALTDVWTLGASGVWSVAANWSLGHAPNGGQSVDIEAAAPFTVTFDKANLGIFGLTLAGASLDLEGGSLTASGAATLQNATITGVKPLVLAGASALQGLTVGGGAILYNKGLATQSGGALAIGDAAGSTAFVRNLAGATWTVSDTSGMTQGSATGWRFFNNGLFQKTSGSGIALIQANFISTGTIASAAGGDIEFDGKWTSLSGTFIGSGMIDYGPDGVAIIGSVNVTGSTCQSNWGVVNLVGTMTMYDGSTIMNAAGARWNFAGDSSLVLAAGQADGPDINGLGTIAKTAGTGVSHVGIDATAEGAVYVLTGTLSFEGASTTFSSWIGGAGTLRIGAGAATIASGAGIAVANWTLAGGVTTLNENLSYSGWFTGEAGASLVLGGHQLYLWRYANLNGLSIGGAGALAALGGAQISGLIGGTVALVEKGEADQTGDVTLGDGTATNAARILLGDHAVWRTNGHNILLGADPASSISIQGGTATSSSLLSCTGNSVVAPAIVNNGVNIGGSNDGIVVSNGVLELQGVVVGTGSDNISGAATLQFDRGVGAGQTVFFNGPNETLAVGRLDIFNAQIAGFAPNDTLSFSGGWSFAGANETTTATTLSFSRGAAHHDLTLQGDYTSGGFHAVSAGGVLNVNWAA